MKTTSSDSTNNKRTKGQVLVIFAVSLLALLFFIGLALDSGVVYVNYGQLKRAVDAGAVAAANNFKTGASNEKMYAAVLEMMKLQNVNIDPTKLHLIVTTCDMNKDGYQDNDPAHPGPNPLPAEFAAFCPLTDPGNANAPTARKLVYVKAEQQTPLYFLSLLGIGSVNLTTSSTAEAAAVDLMLVLDTSESMGNRTVSPVPYGSGFDFDPATCNSTGVIGAVVDSTCYPLRNAIDAANHLVDTLYQGYDNIGLITYDTVGHVPGDSSHKSFGLTSLVGTNINSVKDQIRLTKLHDDPPYKVIPPVDPPVPPYEKFSYEWYGSIVGNASLVNPANLEDRNGDGFDADPRDCWLEDDLVTPRTPSAYEKYQRWDARLGKPCDTDPGGTGLTADTYDWNQDGVIDATDDTLGKQWLATTGNSTFSLVSTCTGCGIRLASNELKLHGRPGAVWVIVVLSDGLVNMSDTPDTAPTVGSGPDLIPPDFHNGFCTQHFWGNDPLNPSLYLPCTDYRVQNKGASPAGYPDNPYRLRYCIDEAAPATAPATPLPDRATCPPGSQWEVRDLNNNDYSPFDYALDMVDSAALRVNTNPLNPLDARYNKNEPLGNDIAIYSIGLGTSVAKGVPLLRYMAAVGDDGDRVTDECLDTTPSRQPLDYRVNCGQYFFALNGADLAPIFDSIASRIYTKITR